MLRGATANLNFANIFDAWFGTKLPNLKTANIPAIWYTTLDWFLYTTICNSHKPVLQHTNWDGGLDLFRNAFQISNPIGQYIMAICAYMLLP